MRGTPGQAQNDPKSTKFSIATQQGQSTMSRRISGSRCGRLVGGLCQAGNPHRKAGRQEGGVLVLGGFLVVMVGLAEWTLHGRPPIFF